ncbi:MAG TPA: PP2C family protein-serine/threonine phosphatase [Acidobacteriaceae bacterium]|jgi:hypothetical protein|nr:PP2C family protein-serine/threonine phosphatase [Acidobacteriaceae bacterium]
MLARGLAVVFAGAAAAPAFAAVHAAATGPLDLPQQLHSAQIPVAMTGFIIISVLSFAIAVACLICWWNARTFHAFRSMGFYLLMVSTIFFADFIHPGDGWEWAPMILGSAAFVELFADAFDISKRGWIVPLRLVWLILIVLGYFPAFSWAEDAAIDISVAASLILLILGLRHARGRDRSLAIALAIAWIARLPLIPSVRWLMPIGFTFYGWRFNWGPLVLVLDGTVILTFFVRDLLDDRLEKQRLSAEFEAGRAVQQVLLGTEIPQLAGLRIHSVYKPAGEVGGDFYLVLPKDNGAVLIAVGDVSGKGLRAAMTVSAVLGALHAIPGDRPAEVLQILNRSLIGRLHGGFVTCCIARVDCAGHVTAANAGHIAPYRGEQEIAFPPGLPLGVTTEPDYAEISFTLNPLDRLTFVSDGVVEARNPSGDLFGFERTRSISAQSAEAIAQAAQDFGQDDDITVLTLALQPA